MHRLVWSTLFVLAACDSVDDRPLELEYLTTAIFQPTCGTTQCHSTFKQAANLVFDNPKAARRSLLDNGLIRLGSSKYDPDDPGNADLIIWVTEIDPFGARDANGNSIGRMPNDAPMPNKDVYLLREWIQNKAEGASCNPEDFGGMACDNMIVVRCTAEGTFGDRVQACTNGCEQGMCL